MALTPSLKQASASLLAAVLVFAIATVSFFGNVFNAANPDWFRDHQVDSEQLVLDGLLAQSLQASKAPLLLGRYSRPNHPDQLTQARELYLDQNREGSFNEYFSQYGLQLRVFSFLVSHGFSLWALHLVVSAALGLCLSASYLILRSHHFSGIAAASFPICLALSPWVVVFARNLYWVPFTWFLPALVTALAATLLPTHAVNGKSRLLLFAFGIGLFLAALAKFLCGYEYITTVYCAALLSFWGLAFRRGCSSRLILSRLVAITLIFALAFGSALCIHASQLNGTGRPGVAIILKTALKRTSSSNPDQLARQACDYIKAPAPLRECISTYTQSLTANPFRVFLRYLFVPSFLPWVHEHAVQPAHLTDQQRGVLQNAIASLKSFRIAGAAAQLASVAPAVIVTGVQRGLIDFFSQYGLLALLAWVVLAYWGSRSTLLYLAGLVAGTASWFFAAKGHAYIHYHMNYVLWYLICVPACVLLLVDRLRLQVLSRLRVGDGSSRSA